MPLCHKNSFDIHAEAKKLFSKAFGRLARFPALKTLQINCSFDGTNQLPADRRLCTESFFDRYKLLEQLLHSILRSWICGKAPKTMRRCVLDDVIGDMDVFRNHSFRPWMENLSSLSLAVTDGRIIGDQLTEERVSRFWAISAPVQLLRHAKQLTSLSIGIHQAYGFMPELGVNGLHFEYLNSLSLRHVLFSHPDQEPCDIEDFIARHGQTLQSLTLDSCPMYLNHWDSQRPWSDVWCRLESDLPELNNLNVSWDEVKDSDPYFVMDPCGVGYVRRGFDWGLETSTSTFTDDFSVDEDSNTFAQEMDASALICLQERVNRRKKL